MNLKVSKIFSAFELLLSLIKIKFFKKRIPLYCEWEVTSRCNMKCGFCSTSVRNRNEQKNISTEKALSTIDQLAELGTKMIHFSGGEPTLRSDMSKLISYAQSKGIIVALTTNGSASERVIKEIAHADIIRVSIDGPEEFHDRIRRYPGAYKKAISFVKYLQSIGKTPQITSVFLWESTNQYFEELAKTCKQLGVSLIINLQGINVNAPDAQTSKSIFTKLAENYLDCVKSLRKKFGKTVLSCEPIPKIIKCGGLDKFGCKAMNIAISIKPDGSISLPCTGLTKKSIAGHINDAFWSREAGKIAKQQGKYPECRGCYIKCMCSASCLLKLSGLISIIKTYIANIIR